MKKYHHNQRRAGEGSIQYCVVGIIISTIITTGNVVVYDPIIITLRISFCHFSST